MKNILFFINIWAVCLKYNDASICGWKKGVGHPGGHDGRTLIKPEESNWMGTHRLIYFCLQATTLALVCSGLKDKVASEIRGMGHNILVLTVTRCKSLRPCYHDMVSELRSRDEESCIEDAAIGASTVFIFLKAIKQYCPEIINVNSEALSFESRYLYEVLLTKAPEKGKEEEYQNRPIIIIDAGMEAGTESVGLALFLIEQLAACGEYNEMLEKIRWIILPAVNPDGMEYSRFNHLGWRKNVRPSEDQLSFGVDISRNFDAQWSACDRVDSGFSPVFPGSAPATENETMFVKNILGKYKKDAKAYLSIRRDGHAILYPYAYAKNSPPNSAQLSRVAGNIAAKVNQRAGGVQLFHNDSIFHMNGKERCGHSVDYALDLGISYSYEMRVFVGSDNRIIERFQAMPRGYDNSLRAGYFTGIRELFNAIVNEKKYRYF